MGLEEVELALRWFQRQPTASRVMFDVGGHHGTSSELFASQGWRIHAFEPDPHNRAAFERRLGACENVTLDSRAVSDRTGDEVTLYDSTESSGISTLTPFVDSHRPAAVIKTVRLDDFVHANEIERVDFLKIDTEGHDLMVLKGFPWDTFRPDIIVCEFEDNKTTRLGYDTADMIEFLSDLGYSLLISEWHPIERYGAVHSFERLYVFEGAVPAETAWGNLVAIRDHDSSTDLVRDAAHVLERREPAGHTRYAAARFEAWRGRAFMGDQIRGIIDARTRRRRSQQ
jgi:FkbM family methyltransferase